MGKKEKRQVLYPPVVAAHISNNLGDIVEPHINDHNSVEIYLSSQPNSHPHLGTLTTISSAFALAHHLTDRFGLEAKVTLEALDNAPAAKKEVNGATYFKPMCFAEIEDGESLADRNLKSFEHFLNAMSDRSQVPYGLTRYSQIQGSSIFREKLFNIMDNEADLSRFLNPVEGHIKLRSICPTCYLGDKSGKSTKTTHKATSLHISSMCPEHKEYEQDFTLKGDGFIDLNTPLRSVIRKVIMMDKAKKDNSLKIMVDGADWVGMAQQLLPCLHALGYSIKDLPLRFFSPLIEDWAGSKFSKSAYVTAGDYKDINPAFRDYTEFRKSLGEKGLDLIWKESSEWISDSRKFFRNYTIDYFMQKWELDSD